ncbi:MAG: nucleotidyltransferase family protein, partial [Anaerolineae bacterium]|nr:nucleotidyltransferase family protein [Anaerolineae bacterium]
PPAFWMMAVKVCFLVIGSPHTFGYSNMWQYVYNLIMVAANRDDIVKVLKSRRTAYKRYGVKSLAVFGSAARNRLRKRSDVDILVQFDKPTWANYIGLKFYLEDLLGREVDLVTPKGLKPAIRSSVESDLLNVVS